MPTNHEALDALKATFPKNRQHALQAAYELGLNELDTKLHATPRPAGTSPATLPALNRSILYHTLLLKVQSMQLPCHRYDLTRDEKHRAGLIQKQTEANLGYMVGLLPKYLRIGHQDGTMSAKEAAAEYLDNLATVLWEGMDALLCSADPVKAVSLLRLMQEEGFDSIVLTDDAPAASLKIAS